MVTFAKNEAEALAIFKQPLSSHAQKATAVGVLTGLGWTSKRIRNASNFSIFQVSYYRSIYKRLNPCLFDLWHKNDCFLSLSHVRAIIRVSRSLQEDLMRTVLQHGYGSRRVDSLAASSDQVTAQDTDYRILSEHVTQVIGFPVTINRDDKSGTINITWYSIDDCEMLLTRLGFDFDSQEDL